MSPADIRHVVVLVLENQSFDRMLGYVTLPDPRQKLDGITGRESNPVSPTSPGDLITVSKATTPDAYVTDPSPGHSFDDAIVQLFAQRQVPDPPVPTNNGFVLSYSEQPGPGGKPLGPVVGRTIMQCLDPALVPVISSLAQNFVVRSMVLVGSRPTGPTASSSTPPPPTACSTRRTPRRISGPPSSARPTGCAPSSRT